MISTGGHSLLVNLSRALLRRGADRDRSSDLALKENEAWSTQVRGPSVEVTCLSGMIWVTREGDPEDRVLPEGATFVTGRKGRLAMLALRPARVRVTRHEPAGAVAPAPPAVCSARGRSGA